MPVVVTVFEVPLLIIVIVSPITNVGLATVPVIPLYVLPAISLTSHKPEPLSSIKILSPSNQLLYKVSTDESSLFANLTECKT